MFSLRLQPAFFDESAVKLHQSEAELLFCFRYNLMNLEGIAHRALHSTSRRRMLEDVEDLKSTNLSIKQKLGVVRPTHHVFVALNTYSNSVACAGHIVRVQVWRMWRTHPHLSIPARPTGIMSLFS